jgi:hypothetical protein
VQVVSQRKKDPILALLFVMEEHLNGPRNKAGGFHSAKERLKV